MKPYYEEAGITIYCGVLAALYWDYGTAKRLQADPRTPSQHSGVDARGEQPQLEGRSSFRARRKNSRIAEFPKHRALFHLRQPQVGKAS